MIQRFFCALGFHGESYREMTEEFRLWKCEYCHRTVSAMRRPASQKPAHERMKAKRVESRDVLKVVKR